MSVYRTRTYIVGDWDHDKNAIDKLYEWNEGNYWSLSFTDAHDLKSVSDNSKTRAYFRRPNKFCYIRKLQMMQEQNSYTVYCVKGYKVDY